MESATGQPHQTDRYLEIRRVTLVGSVVDLTLGVAKIVGGWIGHSEALIADGVHSLSDLVTDVGVILAAKHADTRPDAEHPYGHDRIETAATAGLALALLAVSGGIAFDATLSLFEPETLLRPTALALVVAVVSVVSKEAIYRYTWKVAQRLNSQMLRANAWHSRSDAASSVVVIIGVAGNMMGIVFLDAAAAIVVALMVGHIGWRLAQQSIGELIDTGLATEQIGNIKSEIVGVAGVQDMHMLRTRQMAGRALVDVHINLSNPHISASEAHHISEAVRRRLISEFDDVSDVTVHTDTEDDRDALATDMLPARAEIMRMLESDWAELEESKSVRRVTLHYLAGRVEVDLELPLALALAIDTERAQALARRFAQASAHRPEIGPFRVLLEP